jgi:hypothetical protein
MYRFEALDDVQSTLQKLMQREPPLAAVLPRQPGTKESRYAHLLAGKMDDWEVSPISAASTSSGAQDFDRITHLEEEIAGLHREIADLKQQLASFRKQFE